MGFFLDFGSAFRLVRYFFGDDDAFGNVFTSDINDGGVLVLRDESDQSRARLGSFAAGQ
jgi:hypothetical protein